MKKELTLPVSLVSLAVLLLLAAQSSWSAPAPYVPTLRLQTFDTRMEAADVDTVCCRLGHRVWWTVAQQCRGSRGSTTSDSACAARHAGDSVGQNICCHKDANKWWSTYDKCASVGGRATPSDTCGVEWNNHVPRDEIR